VVVGDVEVIPLVDAVGVLGPLAEVFPDVPAEEWRRYRTEYPQLFAGDSWRLFCTCYVLRTGGRTVLVDTGVGPPGLWDWEPEWEGGLPRELERHGIAPADVDLVLLTHVHVDHVGWNTDAAGDVVFPRARYLLHADALAAAHERAERPHIQRCVLGIADRLETLADGADLAPGVTPVELPGHDRGHLGVRVGADALLITDAAVHPALLDRPDSAYASDFDHERVAATRRRLLDELVDRPVLAVCGHYPNGGIGRVAAHDGHVVWEAA
jgi:glyoxylase-like metal-dependent hydrolase (beta-lactamase superfamily II)